MTRKTLGRTLVGAALTVVLSTLTLGPASAAPVIAWDGITPDGSYAYGAVPTPTCSASDDVDATIALTCVVTGAEANPAVGSHTLTATVSDINGSVVASETISYTVTSWYSVKGFYSPVKMTKVNTRKAGSTVPLKFKVYKDGAKVTSNTVVASIMAQQYVCGDAAMTPIGLPVSVTTAKKGFTLKYRYGAFHQNWKTPKLAKPAKVKGKKVVTTACYLVTATMDDTSTLSAQFLLK